jgi:DNA uptake protein ComE-like DNA-binding protein
MHNVNRNPERGRQWRNGPSDDAQQSIPGVSAADVQNVDLNRATEMQLVDIDDIDAQLAHNIVAYRVHHGHFESWEDVRKVPGIDGHHIQALQHAARLGGQADALPEPTHRDSSTTGGVP